MKHPFLFMLLAGATLFGVQQLRTPTDQAARVVTVAPGQGPDDAILLAEAYRLGWHETDPIVVGHLVQTMGFARPDVTEPARLMELAHQTGLSRSDHMVHARLRQRMEDTLKAGVPTPTEEQLVAWRASHMEDFRQDDAIAFSQWLVPHGTPRPPALDDPERAPQHLPPGLRAEESGSVRRLTSLYGEAFVQSLPETPTDAWIGPVPTLHGDHWLKVTSYTPGTVPPLSRIRAKVASAWTRHQEQLLFETRLQALRQEWRIVSEETLVQREAP